MNPLELHLAVETPSKALEYLQSNSILSTANIKSCFDNGAVWLQEMAKPHRIRDTATQLLMGQEIHLYCNQNTLDECPYQPQLVEDYENFSIWNKPSGMLSQGSKWGDHWALYRWIEQHYWPQRQSFITHRLDRFTQGLMIVAHDSECNHRFHRMFEKQQVKKTYRAVVQGLVDNPQPFDVCTDVQNKSATTHFSVIEHNQLRQYSLIEAKPETGRKHQIRIHLASIGHPVVNDRLYGNPPHHGDLQLQACALEFDHPNIQQKIQMNLNEKHLLLCC